MLNKFRQLLKSIFKPTDPQVFSLSLFEETRPEISISVTIAIRSDGSLEVAGKDYGPLVNELQGKMDYEYFLLVSPGSKNELKEKLQTEGYSVETDNALLRWFQQHYSKNAAFSEIVSLLEKMQVKHEVSIW